MKISIIGTYPPPIGGVSVHIKRLTKILSYNHIDAEIYTTSLVSKKRGKDEKVNHVTSYSAFMQSAIFSESKILHFHVYEKKIRIFAPLIRFVGKKVLLTIHSSSVEDQYNESNLFLRLVYKYSLKNYSKIICVNSHIKEFLLKQGVHGNKIEVIHAYLKPDESPVEYDKIPNKVWKFIESKELIICANGFVRMYKGTDLYGLDMLIDLIDRLKDERSDIGMIIALLGSQQLSLDAKRYYRIILDKIKERQLDKHLYIYEVNNTEFYPILKRSDIFVRPTCMDGYGVSLAEATYFDIPSIASDVIKRPNGTILFKNRDFENFYATTKEVLENYTYYKKEVGKIKVEDASKPLLRLYKGLLLNQKGK